MHHLKAGNSLFALAEADPTWLDKKLPLKEQVDINQFQRGYSCRGEQMLNPRSDKKEPFFPCTQHMKRTPIHMFPQFGYC